MMSSGLSVNWQDNKSGGAKADEKRSKTRRSALGDISNRGARAVGSFVRGAGKKKTGPAFAVSTDDERKADYEGTAIGIAKPNLPKSLHSTPPPAVDEADVADLGNPKYAAEYVGCIFKHYHLKEAQYLPSPGYLCKQTDVNEKMRSLLVDWIIQVHVKFELLPQTLYLTVNLLDRYLERVVVERRKLQLVGCAAMLAASKVEEIYCIEVQDVVAMSDRAFTADDLLKMECTLLNELDFRLTLPSPYTFLRRYMKVACSSAKTQHFATFLVERSLQEYTLLKYKPSMIAAAALSIAQSITEPEKTWTEALTRASPYDAGMLHECVHDMKLLYADSCNTSHLQAVVKKYSASKFMAVADLLHLIVL